MTCASLAFMSSNRSGRTAATEISTLHVAGRLPARLFRAAPGGKDRREQTTFSRLDGGGDYRMKIMWAAIK